MKDMLWGCRLRKKMIFRSILMMVLLGVTACGKNPNESKAPTVVPSSEAPATENLDPVTTTGEILPEGKLALLEGKLIIDDYSKISYSWESEISEEQLTEQLELLAEQYVSFESLDVDAVEDGDWLRVHFTFKDAESDETLAEGKDYYLQAGENCVFGTNCGEALVGVNLLEEQEITLTENYEDSSAITEVSGHSVVLSITIDEICEKTTPTIDDGFIAEHFEEYDSVEAYKQAIREAYAENAKVEAEKVVRDYVAETIVAGAQWKGEKPDSAAQKQVLWERCVNAAATEEITIAEYAEKHYSMTEEELSAYLLQTAEKQLTVYYAMLGIAEREQVSISDEEYAALLPEYREEHGAYNDLSDEKYELLIGKEEIRNGMLSDKMYELLLAQILERGKQ